MTNKMSLSLIRTYSNSTSSGGAPQESERSLTEYIHHLEKVQQRLLGNKEGEIHSHTVLFKKNTSKENTGDSILKNSLFIPRTYIKRHRALGLGVFF